MNNFKYNVQQAFDYISAAENHLARAIEYVKPENVDRELWEPIKLEEKPRLHKRVENLRKILVALSRKGF